MRVLAVDVAMQERVRRAAAERWHAVSEAPPNPHRKRSTLPPSEVQQRVMEGHVSPMQPMQQMQS